MIAALIVLYTQLAFAQNQVAADRTEQSSFGMESSIKRPVEIPAPILRELQKDEDTRTCTEGGKHENFSPKWYAASEIHLEDRVVSFIVLPKNSCMWGANIGPMWIFKSDGSLVLKIRAAAFKILSSQTHGHRDIEIYAHNAVETYTTLCKFDGKTYQVVSRKAEKI